MNFLLEAILAVIAVIAGFVISVIASKKAVSNTTAIRHQQTELAIGDAMGASFIDSTLAMGIGPIFAPVAVRSGIAVFGSLAAAAAVGIVALLLSIRGVHTRYTGFTRSFSM